MLNVEQLRKCYPLIVTPSHDGKFFYNYVLSILNLQNTAMSIGMPMQFLLQQGESLVTRARNNCVAQFLDNPEWTHLFWIDSDIGFSADAALRLLAADYDIAAGVYPLKYDVWPQEGFPAGITKEAYQALYQRYTVNARCEVDATEFHIHIQEDGFIAMAEAPTGFMVIKRQVFERMMQHYPELQYQSDSIGFENKGLHYRLFDVMVDPETKRYLSEDYGFCRLWEGMGEKIYVDALSKLTHQGTKVYEGNYGAALRDNLGNAVPCKEGLKLFLHGTDHLQKLMP
ncbi:hypothetical protein ADP71_20940 [Vitreoscilla sp. C1]|uniref:hypothetical protein n=1 Tax=Vitreoscilla sp. (strain C1) TaxID=96942 RepID=UPI000CDC20B9|nr:hypothetical protein [Vitreoscilla sp. C1]AUZ05539.1 hypothetical protein ADP71_20940 [Vitreoscilla sp. C1]